MRVKEKRSKVQEKRRGIKDECSGEAERNERKQKEVESNKKMKRKSSPFSPLG